MRKFLFVGALMSAALWIGGGQSLAQQQTPPAAGNAQQAAPDAPQPQKKPTKSQPSSKPSASPAEPAGAPSSDSPAASSGRPPDQSSDQPSAAPAKSSASPHSASEDNPFPEDISRKAAEAAGDAQPPANPPAQSSPAAKPSSSANSNPFPEDVSRKAAEAAAKNTHPEASVPPGESSSNSSGLTSGLDQPTGASEVADPVRAKKDTQVGDFYLAQGDYKGAFLRYQDAMKFDPANINAIFGAAEAARGLGNISEAARNYQMYLEIEPNGSKAKRALKALNSLSNKK